MRISDRMMQMNTMAGLRANLNRLAEAQRHATSGKRIERVSDDPVDAARAMRMQGQLNGIDQYRRNAVSATTRMSTETVVLKSARDLLERARKLAIGVTSDDPNDPTRAAALREVSFIKQQLVSLANTSVGDERLFGGGDTAAPFQANGVYTGGDVVHSVQIDDNVALPTSHTGHIFDNTFAALVNLENRLTAGPASDIAAAVKPLADAGEELLGVETETGARQRQGDDTVKQIGRRQQLLLDRMQAIVDADPAESLLKVTAATQALERAYAITQKTMSLNLSNYLR